MRYDFASDNRSGATPEVVEALVAAASGYSGAYGDDSWTSRAADLIRSLLDCDAEVYFVTTGTAANAISLAALCRPFEAVIAHKDAHIVNNEAGAPEHFGHGLGFMPQDGTAGKIDLQTLKAVLAEAESTQCQAPAVLALTNTTEYGALYSSNEVEALNALAHENSVATFLDGARLANAVASGFDLKRISKLGIDIMVMGGTKAGMISTEAIVLFDKNVRRRFRARLKQSGQMPSKSRFMAAPWIAMLESGTWLSRSAHANAMAGKLAAAMPFEVVHPVEGNAVHIKMDSSAQERLTKKGWSAIRMQDDSVRFMCSWATTAAAVEELVVTLTTVRSAG